MLWCVALQKIKPNKRIILFLVLCGGPGCCDFSTKTSKTTPHITNFFFFFCKRIKKNQQFSIVFPLFLIINFFFSFTSILSLNFLYHFFKFFLKNKKPIFHQIFHLKKKIQSPKKKIFHLLLIMKELIFNNQNHEIIHI
jgi:hypothetical protein